MTAYYNLLGTLMNLTSEQKLEMLEGKVIKLKRTLEKVRPRYEELLEFASEHMYNFNSGIWPNHMNMDWLQENYNEDYEIDEDEDSELVWE